MRVRLLRALHAMCCALSGATAGAAVLGVAVTWPGTFPAWIGLGCGMWVALCLAVAAHLTGYALREKD